MDNRLLCQGQQGFQPPFFHYEALYIKRTIPFLNAFEKKAPSKDAFRFYYL
jgi:hypothetical protein